MRSNNAFSPFGYSSGEATAATSDAQNVDFGTGTDPARFHSQLVRGNDATPPPEETFNATPEDRTSLFGVVWYPFGGRRAVKEKGVPVAVRVAKRGAGQTNGPTRGRPSGDVIGTVAVPVNALRRTFGTLDGQNEAAVPRRYVGQL